MSHMVNMPTKVYDTQAVSEACRRLNLAEPTQGKVEFYNGTATGLVVKLPGWEFPVAIDTTTGNIKFDNYGGHWGDTAQLEKFLQMYAVEKTRLETRKKGHCLTEQVLEDGSIRLRIQVGYSNDYPPTLDA